MEKEAKILVISNNGLSYSSSNGRTMLNLLSDFKKEQVHNFFVSGSDLAIDRSSFYQITDSEVIKSIFKKTIGKEVLKDEQTNGQLNPVLKASKKTAFKMMIRDFLWNKKNAINSLIKWSTSFNPNVIVFQSGDSIFMMKIAIKLSEYFKIPIVVFNSEDYFYKTYDFFKETLSSSYLYRKWHRKFQKTFNILMSKASDSVYLTEGLKELYDQDFSYNHPCVIHNSSSILRNVKINIIDKKNFVYCGNLGCGRLDSLIDVAKTLNKVNKTFYIDVYSKLDGKDLKKIKEYPNIIYKGFVSYEETIKVMKEAFCILHVESFNPFYLVDTRNAFSTKLADLFSINNRTMFYCPKSSYVSKYLLKNDIGVSNDLTSLEKDIINLSKNNFHYLCDNNDFDLAKNSLEFKEIIKKSISLPSIQLLISTVNKNSLDEIKNMLDNTNIECDCLIRNQMIDGTVTKLNDMESFDYYGKNVVIYSSNNEKGLSKSRNYLLKKSSSNVILFLDDDMVLNNGYREQILSDFASSNITSKEYSLSWGDTKNIYKNNKKNKYYYHSGDGIMNIALKRQFLIEKHLFFDERFGTGSNYYCGEDTIFRKYLFSYKGNHRLSSFYLEHFPLSESSWHKKDDEIYYLTRSLVYGYCYRYLAKLMVNRMFIKNRNKKIALKKCFKQTKIGQKLYLYDINNKKCYY